MEAHREEISRLRRVRRGQRKAEDGCSQGLQQYKRVIFDVPVGRGWLR